MNRRRFLAALSASALSASALAWPDLARAQAQAPKAASDPQPPKAPDQKEQPAPAKTGDGVKRLVTIFVRGGLDWLSAVPPVALPRYHALRPTIALPPPETPGGALRLAGAFGLHPALEPLLEFWKAGNLALVQAVGLPAPQRAHQDAQRAFESGMPLERVPRDGWMGRLLPLLSAKSQALSLASRAPLICQGRIPAVNVAPTGFPPAGWKIDRPEIFLALDQVYRGQDALDKTYRQSQVVLRNKLSGLEREVRTSTGDAPSVHALPELAVKIAQYLETKPATRLAFLGLGGIDSHTAQGAGRGRLAEALYSLGRGLAALGKALGPALPDTLILVVSEFGRSLPENDYAGTENGYGGMALLLGGRVAGGRFHGDWPGLEPDKLVDGADLAVTTDYREVLAQVCLSHFGLTGEALGQVLPGYLPTGGLKDLFLPA